jgi:hypothetical protein
MVTVGNPLLYGSIVESNPLYLDITPSTYMYAEGCIFFSSAQRVPTPQTGGLYLAQFWEYTFDGEGRIQGTLVDDHKDEDILSNIVMADTSYTGGYGINRKFMAEGTVIEGTLTSSKAQLKVTGESYGTYVQFTSTIEAPAQGGVTLPGGNGGGSSGSPGCFSSTDTVHVLTRGEIGMKYLQVGDKVLTGKNKYEPIYSFGHYHESKVWNFVKLQTSKQSLTVSGDHLVFFLTDRPDPIRADEVKVGDHLSTGIVSMISTTQKQGLYMPLTPSGKIIVNNVEASAYVSMADYAPIQQHPLLRFWMSEHLLSHLWLSPYRVYCMGVCSSYCPNHAKNIDGDEGIMGYLLAGKELAEFALKQPLLVQLLIGIPIFASLLVIYAIEIVAGPLMAPLFILLVAVLFMKCHKTQCGEKKND